MTNQDQVLFSQADAQMQRQTVKNQGSFQKYAVYVRPLFHNNRTGGRA